MKHFALFLPAVALGLALTPIQPHACECAAFNPPLVEYDESDAVFQGTVLQIEPAADPGLVAVTMLATGAWKGVDEQLVTVYTPSQDAACGYTFEAGQQYLVYAVNSTYPCCTDGVATFLCNRTRPLANAQEDLSALGDPSPVSADLSTWGSIKNLYR